VKWISKVFRFEAGHRVWKQNLTYGRGADFTIGKEIPVNKCINLHGHSYVLEVVLGSACREGRDTYRSQKASILRKTK
jgi:6-pyruvoyltetrahydropterin/6-carboxytetrahydropterin synthase